MQPHQQRVIDEKTALDTKLESLRGFFTNAIFITLPSEEKERLCRQENAMADYSEILGERIAAFPKDPIDAMAAQQEGIDAQNAGA